MVSSKVFFNQFSYLSKLKFSLFFHFIYYDSAPRYTIQHIKCTRYLRVGPWQFRQKYSKENTSLRIAINYLRMTIEKCHKLWQYAEVVAHVAGSLEAGGLPGYPESEINVLKSWQGFVALYFQQMMKTWGLKPYTKCSHVIILRERKMVCLYR